MTFSILFRASDPIGRDNTATALVLTNPKTTNPADESITFGGSYLAEPYLSVVLNSGTGLTAKTMTITNTATGASISVTRTWVATDELIIDVANKQVYVNSVLVDYNGIFPTWEPGVGLLRYSDNFTTRSVTITGSYTKRYL